MPDALKNSGLWFGTGGLLLIGAMCVHCMHLLVQCSHELCSRTGDSSLSYADMAETACHLGPRKVQRVSSFFR